MFHGRHSPSWLFGGSGVVRKKWHNSRQIKNATMWIDVNALRVKVYVMFIRFIGSNEPEKDHQFSSIINSYDFRIIFIEFSVAAVQLRCCCWSKAKPTMCASTRIVCTSQLVNTIDRIVIWMGTTELRTLWLLVSCFSVLERIKIPLSYKFHLSHSQHTAHTCWYPRSFIYFDLAICLMSNESITASQTNHSIGLFRYVVCQW